MTAPNARLRLKLHRAVGHAFTLSGKHNVHPGFGWLRTVAALALCLATAASLSTSAAGVRYALDQNELAGRLPTWATEQATVVRTQAVGGGLKVDLRLGTTTVTRHLPARQWVGDRLAVRVDRAEPDAMIVMGVGEPKPLAEFLRAAWPAGWAIGFACAAVAVLRRARWLSVAAVGLAPVAAGATGQLAAWVVRWGFIGAGEQLATKAAAWARPTATLLVIAAAFGAGIVTAHTRNA